MFLDLSIKKNSLMNKKSSLYVMCFKYDESNYKPICRRH